MNKIRRLSAILKFIFYTLFIIYPLLMIAYWLAPQVFHAYGIHIGIPDGTQIMHTLSWSERGEGFLVSLIPNLIAMAIYYCLAKLFALYEQGKIFVVATSRYLNKVGFLLLIGGLLSPLIIDPLMQFVLTIHNPAGHCYAGIALGSGNLYDIFIALLIILISWIMLEGCKISAEHQLTV